MKIARKNEHDNNCDNNELGDMPDLDSLDLDDLDLSRSPLESKYVDYSTREIFLNGGIDERTIKNYVLPIIHFNNADDGLQIPIEERQPIIIYLNCYGGDIFAGFSLIDVIEASKTPVACITLSYAFSMGFLISLACHYRYCYKHTAFLIHDGEMNLSNTSSKVKTLYNYLLGQEKMVKDYIISKTKISKKVLNKNFETDWYLNAEEAIKYGIVDEILTANI